MFYVIFLSVHVSYRLLVLGLLTVTVIVTSCECRPDFQ